MWNRAKMYEKAPKQNEENEQEETVYGKEEDHMKYGRSSSLFINSIYMASRRSQPPYSRPIPQNRQELLESIGRDREVLGAYFQRLTSQRGEVTSSDLASPNPPALQRNSYDLFFESACISVKGLPPKLAAEAKSRISQIITEFEIRAISEMEAQQERQMQAQPRVDNATGIVYEFRPCS
ncbi:protein suppressor of variegation 3-7 [Drosophila subpulchrella]|uniref:protein suppressor of variegation 3-7 n=1 Tax=Drosophila subpulchrella TaxID=1486046 RepID=UPI0018A1736C|nr:protein suppressor of variegation 3-7 [Drosophila subpulchrella]